VASGTTPPASSTMLPSSQPTPAARPFLPPHLRMSMPAAAATAAPAEAAVQQTAQIAPAAAQQMAVPPQPVQQPQKPLHQQSMQHQQQEMPGLPGAMMAALAGRAQPTPAAAAAAATSAGSLECRRGATAGRVPLVSTPNGALPSVRPAGSSNPTAGGVKGSKLCVSCGQQRRNVLLLPCKHMLLCDACADVDSCPSCGKSCTQRIKVHQS
jgi:hypothetical protein